MNRRNRRSESLKSTSTSQGRAITITVLLTLTTCAFLLASLPALAQDAPADPAAQAQDVEMPREVRVLVQRGLAFLGFDPGPADGLFGLKTRAAIWDWQTAKELDATGYLTLPEAEALAAVGAEASESPEVEFEEPDEREPDGTEAETVTVPSGSRNQVLYFPNCGTDDAGPDGCWLALSSPAECVMWWPRDRSSVPTFASYSGECDDTSRATGQGTLRLDGDWGEENWSGQFIEGEQQGHWVGRIANGDRWEGSYVDGLPHGHWRRQFGDSLVEVYELHHGELVDVVYE